RPRRRRPRRRRPPPARPAGRAADAGGPLRRPHRGGSPMTATTLATAPDRRPGRVTARLAASELRLVLREPAVLVGLVAFPAVTVLVLAGVFGSSPDPDFGGVRPSEHYVVGY